MTENNNYDDVIMNFRRQIADYLRRENLSGAGLARRLDVSHTCVSYWLSGKNLPGVRCGRILYEKTGIFPH